MAFREGRCGEGMAPLRRVAEDASIVGGWRQGGAMLLPARSALCQAKCQKKEGIMHYAQATPLREPGAQLYTVLWCDTQDRAHLS